MVSQFYATFLFTFAVVFVRGVFILEKDFKMLTKRLFGCVVVNPLVSQCNALKEMEELLTMGEKNVNDRSRNTSPSITFFCDLAFY